MIELFGSFVHWFLSYWTANTMHGMQHITLKIYTNTVTCIRAHARRIPRMPQQIEQTLTNLLEWDWNCGELNSSAAATLSHGEQIQTDDHTVLFVIPSLLMCVRLHCCATAAATTATSFSLCLFLFLFSLTYYCFKWLFVVAVVTAATAAAAAAATVAAISLVFFCFVVSIFVVHF